MTVYFTTDGTIYEPTIQQAEDATDHGSIDNAKLLAIFISDAGMCGKISTSMATYIEACKILG